MGFHVRELYPSPHGWYGTASPRPPHVRFATAPRSRVAKRSPGHVAPRHPRACLAWRTPPEPLRTCVFTLELPTTNSHKWRVHTWKCKNPGVTSSLTHQSNTKISLVFTPPPTLAQRKNGTKTHTYTQNRRYLSMTSDTMIASHVLKHTCTEASMEVKLRIAKTVIQSVVGA